MSAAAGSSGKLSDNSQSLETDDPVDWKATFAAIRKEEVEIARLTRLKEDVEKQLSSSIKTKTENYKAAVEQYWNGKITPNLQKMGDQLTADVKSSSSLIPVGKTTCAVKVLHAPICSSCGKNEESFTVNVFADYWSSKGRIYVVHGWTRMLNRLSDVAACVRRFASTAPLCCSCAPVVCRSVSAALCDWTTDIDIMLHLPVCTNKIDCCDCDMISLQERIKAEVQDLIGKS